jgi:hypothetical protein
MAGLPFPEVSVQLTQRRWRCVLDPNLALSPTGAEFARRLAPHAEVWLGTEFFNILDSTSIYEKEPELLAWPGANRVDSDLMSSVLHDWCRLRNESGYGSSPFHWIGDVLRESSLPAGMNEDVVEHWEEAASSLDACLPPAIEGTGPLIATMRDTVALCAVLPATILTMRDKSAVHEVPVLCEHIKHWGITCEQVDDNDEFVAIERAGIRQILIQAGMAKFLWAGMNLVVLHLLATGLGRTATDEDTLSYDAGDVLTDSEPSGGVRAPWAGARAFWYQLQPERTPC